MLVLCGYLFTCFFTKLISSREENFFQLSPHSNITNKLLKSLHNTTRLQCLHMCRLSDQKCLYIAYDDDRNICKLIGMIDQTKEKDAIMEIENNYKVFKGHESYEYANCIEASTHGEKKSGIFYLRDIGWHFCNFDSLDSCGAGGWALSMTVDGSKKMFDYDSTIWTSVGTYNVMNGLQDPFHTAAKYKAFHSLSFDNICLGMQVGSTTRYLKLTQKGSSLLRIFDGEKNTQLIDGEKVLRTDWLNLIPNANLQPSCNKQGFNIAMSPGSVRLGILSNAGDCAENWSSSWIGIGSNHWCSDYTEGIVTAGNQCCAESCQATHIPVFAYLYVR